LVKDIEDLPAQVVINKNLTLDLNGKTIVHKDTSADIWDDDEAWSLISVR
jgi:hypothetical protein